MSNGDGDQVRITRKTDSQQYTVVVLTIDPLKIH